MPGDGGEPVLAATLAGFGRERRVVERRWAAAGPRRGPGLLRLDWSARAVNGAEPAPDPIVRRPGDARRRLFLSTSPRARRPRWVRPTCSVWEFDWDGDDTVVALVSSDHSGSGWYQARSRGSICGARPRARCTSPSWQMEGWPCRPMRTRARRRRGLRERPRAARRQPRGARPRAGRPTDPWPDLQTVGAGVVVRRRFALVREHRRHRQRLRPDLARRPARRALARRRVHRRRGHHARLRDHRRRRRRLDHASGARRGTGAREVRSRRATPGSA